MSPALFFQPAEARTLDAALDQIIPPSADGQMPGAGELGLASAIGEAARQAPELAVVIRAGLEALDALAQQGHAARFADLVGEPAASVMAAVSEARPELVPNLIFHLYIAYYQHDRVVTALGHEARPPHPKGYPLAQGDLSLLDPVRSRPRLYREVSARDR